MSIPKGFVDIPVYNSIESKSSVTSSYAFADPFGLSGEKDLDFYCKYEKTEIISDDYVD